ncbi:hypothetical protein M407DRAFT_244302 [Tulasnella calospora MUT 4182]|uniref:SAP domain-containing protein n=1 Tax=Tulasnella calospora MUT 4182 TaxID=1051891 RepID=A0A0C3KTG8_9AGAM|nr:hypothetical protein M407DRAFT_244302 [Tulasnella calospora MUT 4182]
MLPEERDDAEIQSKLDRVLNNVEALRNEVGSLRDEVKSLSNNFGTFAIPIVQRHNAGCVSGVNFQRLPFADGTWPNEEQSTNLKSLTSINALTVPNLQNFCRLYDLDSTGLKQELLDRLYVHLGVAQVANQRRSG